MSAETASFALAARLGAAVARPFVLLAPERQGLGGLAPAEVIALAARAPFRNPVERALAVKAAEQAKLALSAAEIARMAASAEGRLAALLVSEPLARVSQAALLLAAAALQKQVLGVLQKAERQRMRQVFGPEAFAVATQEAPTLYPGLAAFGSAPAFRDVLNATAVADAQHRLSEYGSGLLVDFTQAAAPGLAGLLGTRLLAGGKGLGLAKAMAPHLALFTRFLRRRMPEWSAIIG